MNELTTLLVPALGAALLGFLWQGAVIGLLAWLALTLLRNARPQARYAVACVALLACVLVPAWQLVGAFGEVGNATLVQVDTLRATDEPASSTPSPGASAFDALPSLPDAALPWIVSLWAAGAGILAMRMACGLLWVRRLRSGSMPCDSGWQARLDRLARRTGVHRVVALRIVADGDSPLSAGWWKPVVLVPAALALRMPAPLLEALLAHELAHIRRHDYLVNLLQGAVEVVLFYHPVVWWLSRRIRIEREQVADDIAAAVIGEPRRLAVALSQIDRYAVPFPAFAQAAHGGQLMSRIQQLVRPDRRAVGGIVVLPLFGLLVAGIAYYAHARTTSVSITRTPTATARVAMPASPVAQAGSASRPPDRTADRVSVTRVSSRDEHQRSTYAFVRKDREGISMSGDLDDVDEIRAARRSIDGDFIWFRRGGDAYVVRDAALLARAEAAWHPLQPLEARMKSLQARMQPHSERMEALGERMERLSDNHPHDDAMAAAAREMEALGERQAALGERQAALGERMIRADEAQRDQLQREREALGAQQQALGQQMERQAAVLEARSGRIQAQHAPMEALGREMEAAGKPMEAIGKQMEVLGKQIERKANVADREIRTLIDEAVARNLAAPAPARQ